MRCSWWSIGAGIVALLVAAGACGGGDGAAGPGDHTYKVDFGVPVTAGAFDWIQGPIWSSDGREIFVFGATAAGKPAHVYGVRVADGAVRVVDSRDDVALPLFTSSDGQWLFSAPYLGGGRYDIERIATDGSGAETLAANGFAPTLGPKDTILAFARVGPLCAPQWGQSTCDSLFTMDLRTRVVRYRMPGIPLAFAPDGRRLLAQGSPCNRMADPNACPGVVLNLVTGAIDSISLGGTEDVIYLTRWIGTSPAQLYHAGMGEGSALMQRDLATGATKVLFALMPGKDLPTGVFPAWSADGESVAYWATYWPQDVNVLHLIRVSNGMASATAVVPGPVSGVALSPDGTQVSYIFADFGNHTLYRHVLR